MQQLRLKGGSVLLKGLASMSLSIYYRPARNEIENRYEGDLDNLIKRIGHAYPNDDTTPVTQSPKH